MGEKIIRWSSRWKDPNQKELQERNWKAIFYIPQFPIAKKESNCAKDAEKLNQILLWGNG